MLDTLSWWLLLELIGLAAFPVAFRFFRNLPDRGYTFVKPLGLLLVAYPYWLFGTLGFLLNTRGTAIVVALVVAVLSWLLLGRRQTTNYQLPITNLRSPISWLRYNARLILATELVFTTAFFAWAFVRAHNPEITATEKPMEFAFLNGILQSDRFPPLDSWLSGYAISYYYFGYVIIALLTMLSGVASSVAFNLAIAMLFALSAVGAYGLAFNLIAGPESKVHSQKPRPSNVQHPISQSPNLFFPLFAPIFLVLIGNLEGFFESLHARGILPASFWNWLDVKNLAQAPVSNSFAPSDYWWWWRASRVIHDVVGGQTQEVIDEFPQFSFLLGDMHPHVLALPFVLLALAAALNLLRENDFRNSHFAIRQWSSLFTLDFLLLTLIVGSLGFLNLWDLPALGFIIVVCYAIARYRVKQQWDAGATRDVLLFAFRLMLFAFLLYLPFYIGFQSQAGGILPVFFVKTRLHQYLVIFGFFVFILGAFLLHLARRTLTRDWLPRATWFGIAAFAFPLAIGALVFLALTFIPALQDTARQFLPNIDNPITAALATYFAPWFADPWLFGLLAVLLALIAALFLKHVEDDSVAFTLLLAFTAFLLTFGSEFVYLRDSFGTRMNTIFKFYFQAWALFSVASAYAVYRLSRDLRGIARGAWFIAFALLLGASLFYPALAIPSKADGFAKTATLDGIEWIRNQSAGDYAAIEWLRENAPRGAVIVEAVGDDYSYGNRISMATGLPTVLGWVGHELQWRGNTKLFEDDAAGVNRRADISRLYQTTDAREALTLLEKYGIRFVVVGGLERSKYGMGKAQMDKFGKILNQVFESGDVRIYARN